MRIFKTALWLSPVLFLSAMGVQAQPSPSAQPNDKAEPPANYVLLVNGNRVPLVLGNEVASKVAGQQVRFKLSRQPFRQFEKSGVRFQYPASYTFAADDSAPGVMIWTVTGNNSTVIMQRFGKLPPAQISTNMVNDTVKQFGAKNVAVSPVTWFMRGRKVPGKRLGVIVGGQTLTQEIYAFSNKTNSFAFVIQDLPEKGKPSAESTKLKVLLTQSLKW